MARWEKTYDFTKVRKAIDEERSEDIINGLIEVCDFYSKGLWDFEDDYKDLADELKEIDMDEMEIEDVDYWLSEFYDLCDSAKVWLR